MSKLLHRFGKFYGRVILRFIGIFIFIGILSVVFGDNGWMPNEDIYAISRLAYRVILPILIAYTSGGQMRKLSSSKQERKQHLEDVHPGGVIAVMAIAGTLSMDSNHGILAAMVLGPISGFLWENIVEPLTEKLRTVAEMLIRNLAIALTGCVMAIASIYLLNPFFELVTNAALLGINYLVTHNLICLASVIIEPAKVFFLNNSINHGILVPLGLQQAEQTGTSMLFLLESNPGPGLGILLAAYLMNHEKKKRKEYATGIFAEFIGGLHEIYFPMVLANIWLLLALIAGGTVGNLIFAVCGGETVSAVSPGSICTVFLVTPRNAILPVLAGIVGSALVSLGCGVCILGIQKMRKSNTQLEPEAEEEKRGMQEIPAGRVHKVGFVCDAGVGSSAMAAALFRRKLAEQQIGQVEVAAYARDQIADDLDIAICQQNFKDLVLGDVQQENIRVVSSLLAQDEYEEIIAEIRRRNGEVL